MKNRIVKRILAAGLVTVMAVSMLAGCGGKGGSDKGGQSGDTKFTWWIYKTDGEGTYYDDYKDSPVVQYINQQYWDVEKGGIGDEKTGTKLDLSFIVPIAGKETDNFNTMIATGEYPEVIDLNGSTESAQAMNENGIVMDITEYVEKYMPNYLAFLDKNPEIKPFVSNLDEDGNVHYYSVHSIKDGVADPWDGAVYRRDWVVKYAVPTEYVWDWDDEYVKENGHPEVTPLAKAKTENNLKGWKKNEVTEFKANPGADPANDYTDNVIFPSGTADPITISDWEWMFEAFKKAITERGWAENSSAYCTTVGYMGYAAQGSLVSSFGGGTGLFYVKDGECSFDGTSDNFKTYVECMNTWYNNGWLDTQFYTRAADMFFSINTTGTTQGMVGLWEGMPNSLGTGIRATCANEEDKQDAFVKAAAWPINDMYGTEEQMYKEPDAMYQDSRKSRGIAITNKAEGKNLEALFTFLDWGYSEEGSKALTIGLSEEQYKSVKLDPDLYAEYDLTAAYTEETNEDGQLVIKRSVDSSDSLLNAVHGGRIGCNMSLTGNTGEYILDKGDPEVNKHSRVQWTKYKNTGSTMDYTSLLTSEESDAYSKTITAVTDYQKQVIPKLITDGMSGWDAYVEGVEKLNPEPIAEMFQKYVELAK